VIVHINTCILILVNNEKYPRNRPRLIFGEFGSGVFYFLIVLIDAFLICVIIRAMQYVKLIGVRDVEEKKTVKYVPEKESNRYIELVIV
jgi:hypothetical protein